MVIYLLPHVYTSLVQKFRNSLHLLLSWHLCVCDFISCIDDPYMELHMKEKNLKSKHVSIPFF
jgi:hypothetical protein